MSLSSFENRKESLERTQHARCARGAQETCSANLNVYFSMATDEKNQRMISDFFFDWLQLMTTYVAFGTKEFPLFDCYLEYLLGFMTICFYLV